MANMYTRLLNRWLLLLVLCLCVAEGSAKTPKYKSTTNHYIGFSIGGGEANDIFTGSESVKPLMGGAANATVSYEVQWNSLLMFMIGLQVQYQQTRDSVTSFMDSFFRTDILGNVEYQYIYSHWMDKNNSVRLTIPVRVGCQVNDFLYILVGADVSFAILASHTSAAEMFTQGLHAWDSRPMRTDDKHDFTANLGYYMPFGITTTAPYREALWVAPSLEIGSYIPINSKKSRLRVGAYLNYGFRLGEIMENTIVDYSSVNMRANPNTQPPEYLQSSAVLHNAMNSNKIAALPSNLEVGVRLTYLLNVTVPSSHCMCDKSFHFK